MRINRSNYETWFIDWIDGNLDHHQVEEVVLFLYENHDLQEEFADLAKVSIKPFFRRFPYKEQLKKTVADVTISQFEYLCVAFLENDLSEAQRSEMMEIIEQNADKKKSFDLIQKTRLAPAVISFKHKNLLFRSTVIQKVIRLSVIGLTAAAAVALFITIFYTAPQSSSLSISKSAVSVNMDTSLQKPLITNRSEVAAAINFSAPSDLKKKNEHDGIFLKKTAHQKPDLVAVIPGDSLINSINTREVPLKRIEVNSKISISKEVKTNTLIASNIVSDYINEDDGRSNISRFISKTFREKILRENTAADTPLKAYEIAEAGVSGLNKLFGWEMALDKNIGENGELGYVCFSSKFLKFNAPVNKVEPIR